MEEMQIWNLFQSARIAGALSAIGIILAIWLALRVAAATRASDESNIITKLLSTVFCGTVVLSAWTGFAQNVTSWALTARSLEDLQASGTEISETATGFIAYVGTTDPVSTPTPVGMVFVGVVGLMMLMQIWMPKQS
ncbi:MAG: hypothetical protein ACPH4G_09395 [Henriciella sp.]